MRVSDISLYLLPKQCACQLCNPQSLLQSLFLVGPITPKNVYNTEASAPSHHRLNKP